MIMVECRIVQIIGVCKKNDSTNVDKNGQKNIHRGSQLQNVDNSVDNVDKLLSEKRFSYFYNVSGAHSY